MAIPSVFPFLYHGLRSLCTYVAHLLVRQVSLGNVPKSPTASHLNGLDTSFDFCCQGPALTGINEVDKMTLSSA